MIGALGLIWSLTVASLGFQAWPFLSVVLPATLIGIVLYVIMRRDTVPALVQRSNLIAVGAWLIISQFATASIIYGVGYLIGRAI